MEPTNPFPMLSMLPILHMPLVAPTLAEELEASHLPGSQSSIYTWSRCLTLFILSRTVVSSMSSTTTITDVRQVLTSGDAFTVVNDYDIPAINVVDEERAEDDVEESFLPANNGVTGREPVTNPSNWLTNHRRMPPHRPPVPHPRWVAVGGPLPMRIFLWDMFSGCQLLQVWLYSILSYTIATI